MIIEQIDGYHGLDQIQMELHYSDLSELFTDRAIDEGFLDATFKFNVVGLEVDSDRNILIIDTNVYRLNEN